MTAQQSVMNSLFTAFAGFTAFGDTLELTGASPSELRRLTGQWLDCHATGIQQAAGIPADERD